PLLRSRISCAIRARLRTIRSASRTTGMFTSSRPHRAALKSDISITNCRMAESRIELQDGRIAGRQNLTAAPVHDRLALVVRVFELDEMSRTVVAWRSAVR